MGRATENGAARGSFQPFVMIPGDGGHISRTCTRKGDVPSKGKGERAMTVEGDGEVNLGRIWIGGCERQNKETPERKKGITFSPGAAVDVIPLGTHHADVTKEPG